MLSWTAHADDIVAFINRFTTHVEGVGDICSLAAFNLQVGWAAELAAELWSTTSTGEAATQY